MNNRLVRFGFSSIVMLGVLVGLGFAPGFGSTTASATTRTILGVPVYQNHDGSAPTAAGMVMAYWDAHGYDLLPGDATTQTAAVNDAIASSGHYSDYALPLDDLANSPVIIADASQNSPDAAHPNDSLADFMGTSRSALGLRYGETLFDYVAPTLTAYFTYKMGLSLTSTSTSLLYSSTLWSTLKTEINGLRPLIFYVDLDGNGSADTYVTVVGYNDTVTPHKYAAYTAGDALLHWYKFGPVAATAGGVSGAVTFNIPAPTKPTLTSPAVNGYVNTLLPTLTWAATPNALKYEVQVAKAYTFKLLQDDYITADNTELSHTIDIAKSLSDGKWYWRARAYKLDGTPLGWTAYRAFTVDTINPADPVLVAPLDNATVRATPKFTWNAALGAKTYAFRYAPLSDPTNFVTSAYSPLLYITPSPVMPLGDYLWQVQAKDAAGNLSNWTTARTLHVLAPIPAAPVLISPANGWETNDTTPTLNWATVPYADHYVVELNPAPAWTPPVYSFTATAPVDTPEINYNLGIWYPKWYWRVCAVNVQNEKTCSAVGMFLLYPSRYTEFNGSEDTTYWKQGAGWGWHNDGSHEYTDGMTPYAYTCGTSTCYIGKLSNLYSVLQPLDDFTYEARLKMTWAGAPPFDVMNAHGLVVRGAPDFMPTFNDWRNAYYFQIGEYYDAQDHLKIPAWSAWRVTNGVYYKMTTSAWNYSSAINMEDWNTLRVWGRGPSMKFYINGTQVWSGTNSSRLQGILGIETWRIVGGTLYVDYTKAGGPQAGSLESLVTPAAVQGLTLDTPQGPQVTSNPVFQAILDRIPLPPQMMPGTSLSGSADRK